MSWTKLEPITPKAMGCANCGALIQQAPMDMLIAVGFGDASVTKDGKAVYSELDCHEDVENFWTVKDAEYEALKDPDHDWRIVLFAPLRGRVFQRQGIENWVLVEENMGFA